ncbi:MAG TPA: DUF2520 domain-containing protein [Acidobacteriota bacterium]|nr:DUF2520 domain-containing protein [Acidobacteriota bacterium]
MSNSEKISWIGCGRVANTLAKACKIAGYEIGIVACRNLKNAEKAVQYIGAGEAGTDIVDAATLGTVHFVTTNDDALAEIVRTVDSDGPGSLQGHYFYHTSGSIASTIFEPLHQKGAEIASIHPLQVFADPDKALETLPGIYYAIEGTDRAMTWAIQLVDKLQGKLLLIPTARKPLYHAASVFAANYLVVLVHLAVSIMEEIGESPEDSYEAFLPLMVSALQNIEEFGTAAALTGPISRGDEKTIETHLKALEELPPGILRAYEVLGQEAVELAARSGNLSADKGRRLLELLKL